MPGSMLLRPDSPVISESGFDLSANLAPVPDSSNEKIKLDSVLDFQDGSDDDDSDEAFIAAQQAASNRKAENLKGRSVKKGGGFQSMGLNANLLKAITRKGFSVPTPIQRKVVPSILNRKDVVAMARTGSGKTAAFVIPMIERLKSHSAKVGTRAVILSPTRELALQTLKAVKELGRGTDLRSVLLVGGDSLEDQFSQMISNPDIVIATPGRLLHLLVEMSLELSSVQYMVFDEADRLFEMGFSNQLTEILQSLPLSRQTLLFSATLPSSLLEFAKAGLREPELIRLDVDNKTSPDLENAFFLIKGSEKDGALLHLLRDVIRIPTESQTHSKASEPKDGELIKKRKRSIMKKQPDDVWKEKSTIIFTPTKHHVDYLSVLLKSFGFSVSYVYGSLDQAARTMQADLFRSGATNVLVVTDVAARGIDMPLLANVINYDFPQQPKVFVHRVGRTARAGSKGWSYSLVQNNDFPYLLDLQLFLGKTLVFGQKSNGRSDFTNNFCVGAIPTEMLENSLEAVRAILDQEGDIEAARQVALKGEKLHSRTRKSASSESVRRARLIINDTTVIEPNLLYGEGQTSLEKEKLRMLARLSSHRPQETVFELGKRGAAAEAAEGMRGRKTKISKTQRNVTGGDNPAEGTMQNNDFDVAEAIDGGLSRSDLDEYLELEDQHDITVTGVDDTTDAHTSNSHKPWEDEENYLSYRPRETNVEEDRGYSVRAAEKNANFNEVARGAVFDLAADESKSYAETSRPRFQWDKKSKKYTKTEGQPGQKLVVGENGRKIPATFKSGRFENWKKAHNLDRLPRMGEAEAPDNAMRKASKRFKHSAVKAPKLPDKYRDDYHAKKKQLEAAKVSGRSKTAKVENELRSVDDIRKQRKLKQSRREKNARPPRRKAT